LKLAAIDIGSNAARLLITEATEEEKGKIIFQKLNLIRIPLRLGFDVFETGNISKEKTAKLIETIKAYRHLLNIYEVAHLKACATSAMRDARNAQEIIKKVKESSGINIEIITGDQEAAYIYENHIAENLSSDHSYLYIDVGGGSTELTFFSKGKPVFKKSFNIGTIRLLKEKVDVSQWEEVKEFLKQNLKGHAQPVAIGSGGNINKVFSLSKKKEGKALSFELLKDYLKELGSVSLKQRMELYQLKEDRADVIVPALQIYVNVMRWADADEIYVPKIGLADGLIHMLYDEVKATILKK
jgi:exopolyphosphatase/guanosine-5'-triphosphate,3'-diphosphate pyrophosphatase